MKKAILFFVIVGLCSIAGPKLGRKNLAPGVSILLPKELIPMVDDEIAAKYPTSRKPLVMYTSEDRNIDFGYNVSKMNWAANDLEMLEKFYKATVLSMYQKATIIRDEIKTINKQKFIVLEFTSQVDRIRNYTFIQYTVIKNNIYIFNFTCPEQMKQNWAPVAEQMMSSVKVNPKQFKQMKIVTPEDKVLERKEKDKQKKVKKPVPNPANQGPANVR